MADDVSAPLPDLTWKDQSIITVDAGDASANITTFTIHLSQDVPEELLKQEKLPPWFQHSTG